MPPEDRLARNEIVVPVAPNDVFDTLMDAASYPAWVPGTKRLAHVDAEWPAPGSAFSFRLFGGLREDKTVLLEAERPRRVVLNAHVRPFMVTRVAIELEPRGPSSTLVRLVETVEWPSRPRLLAAAGDRFLRIRNVEALRRFARLVEP
jgi:uncharacterized protein YndB with AHSA1/START domain